MHESTEEFSRFISLDNRLFCAADGHAEQQVPAPTNIGTPSWFIWRTPVEGRGLVFIKQRQFRREATIAKKPYTEGQALFRQLQGSIGYGMSAIAHFSADYTDSYS
ncbi:hypothetical protein [Paraburkholderia domus]|uniref:hypothetical protein n=1 Tax=Paraburkholderia domus TaxID=2793075 RepID=UPI001913B6C3|nr:hypothetical protein [Paraburkholderia domus]MBK5059560.1 hypothetical protein [Burkholderia sp. R-70199]MBK5164999.1 hypothetical protein [Burkholderia sp. R-70211]